MDIKNGGWEGHLQVTLIDPQEGKYEHRNVNAIIAVRIRPHNLVFIGGKMVTKQTSWVPEGNPIQDFSGAKRISIRVTAQPTRRSASF
jgi:hypothetical protein